MNDLSGTCTPCCALLYEMPLTALLLGESFHPGGDALTRQLAEQALVGPGCQVLDIACGKGNSARLLASEFGAQVTGVDYSGKLLQAAQRMAQAAELSANIQFHQADVHQLPFSDQQYDVAFCECALCTFADAPRVLSEMFRVLKPGGWLALSDVVVNAPLPAQLQTALGHALCIAGARSTDAYQALIMDAGFSAIRSHDVSQVLLDTVQQIAQRLNLAEVIATLHQAGLPQELGNPTAALDIARAVVERGGLGYRLFLARRPRT